MVSKWFKATPEASPTPTSDRASDQEVWSTLQSLRSIDRQQQRIAALEARLAHLEGLVRLGAGILAVLIVLSVLLTGWSAYQIRQNRQLLENATAQ